MIKTDAERNPVVLTMQRLKLYEDINDLPVAVRNSVL